MNIFIVGIGFVSRVPAAFERMALITSLFFNHSESLLNFVYIWLIVDCTLFAFHKIHWAFAITCIMIKTLWGDKLSTLTHMYPHKPWRNINWWSSAITRLAANLRVLWCLIWWCSSIEKRMVTHDTECPYLDQVSLNKSKLKKNKKTNSNCIVVKTMHIWLRLYTNIHPSSSASSNCQILTVFKITLDSIACHYFTPNVHRNELRLHNA